MLKVLWTGEPNDNWEKKFRERFEIEKKGLSVTGMFSDHLKEDDLKKALQGKDMLIAGYDELTRQVLKECPDLKMVLSGRDGPEENVDIEACTEMGIPVLFAGGRCVHSVAEMTLALMFMLAGSYIPFNRDVRGSKWEDADLSLSHPKRELFQKTLSVIGLGRNGKELARLANAVGMKVVAFDPYVSKDTAEELHVELVSLEDALKAGDYISLLARVTPETTGMIGKEQIKLMKPTAYLINTGRAKLTDEDAVLDALENDQIAGAALDVFNTEPLELGHRAYRISEDKLIIMPHLAGISEERVPHQYEYLMDSFDKFLKGETKGLRLYNPKVFDSPEFKNRGGKLFGSEK